MNEKKLKILYNEYAKKAGYSESDFYNLMKSSEGRRNFFNKNNPNLGLTDFNEFESLLGIQPQPQPQPQSQDELIQLAGKGLSLATQSKQPEKKKFGQDFQGSSSATTNSQSQSNTREKNNIQQQDELIPTQPTTQAPPTTQDNKIKTYPNGVNPSMLITDIFNANGFLEEDIAMRQAFSLRGLNEIEREDRIRENPYSMEALSKGSGLLSELPSYTEQARAKRRKILTDEKLLKDYSWNRNRELDEEVSKLREEQYKIKDGVDVPSYKNVNKFGLPRNVREQSIDNSQKIKEVEEYKSKLRDGLFYAAANIIVPNYLEETETINSVEIGRRIVGIVDTDYDMKIKTAGDIGMPYTVQADLDKLGLDVLKKYVEQNTQLPNREKLLSIVQAQEETFQERNFQQTADIVKHKIGAYFYKKGKRTAIIPPTKEEITEAINSEETGLTPAEKKIALSYVLPLESKLSLISEIPAYGLSASFVRGVEQFTEGVVNTIRGAFGDRTNAEQQYENLEGIRTRYQNVGEYAPSVAELGRIQKKIDKGEKLTPQEYSTKGELENYTNIRNAWVIAEDLVGSQSAQIVGIAGLAYLTGGVGITSKVAQLGIPVILSTKDNYYKQALDLMPNPEQSLSRSIYSWILTGSEYFTEGIFDDRKVLNAFLKETKPTILSISTRLASNEMTERAAKDELSRAFKTFGKTFAKEFGKDINSNALEEVANQVIQQTADNVIAGKKSSISDDAKELLRTYWQTAVGTTIIASITGAKAGSKRLKDNAVYKAGLLDMAQNPYEHLRVIDGMLQRGEITQQEANEKIKIVKSANQHLIELPKTREVIVKDKKTGEEQKVEKSFDAPEATVYILHRENERILSEQIEALEKSPMPDEVRIKDLKAKLNRSKAIREGIYNDNIGVTPTLEEVTDNIEDAKKIGITTTDEVTDNELVGTPFERPLEEREPTIPTLSTPLLQNLLEMGKLGIEAMKSLLNSEKVTEEDKDKIRGYIAKKELYNKNKDPLISFTYNDIENVPPQLKDRVVEEDGVFKVKMKKSEADVLQNKIKNKEKGFEDIELIDYKIEKNIESVESPKTVLIDVTSNSNADEEVKTEQKTEQELNINQQNTKEDGTKTTNAPKSELQTEREQTNIGTNIQTIERKAESESKTELNEAVNEADRELESAGVKHKVATIPLNSIIRKPETFQYKASDNKEGTNKNEQIQGEFNPNLAGTLLVWRDEDNELGGGKDAIYLADGHHRMELMNRSDVSEANVFFLDAKTAKEAKVEAAKANIAQGRGTSIDAAKVFKESTAEQLEGFKPTSKVAKEGRELAKLNDNIFTLVSNGKLGINEAIAIAQVPKDKQEPFYKEIQKIQRSGAIKMTKEGLMTMAERINEGVVASKTEVENTLFGTNLNETLLIAEQAQIEADIKTELAKDARILGNANKNKEVLESAGNVVNTEENAKLSEESNLAAGLYNTFKKYSPIQKILKEATEKLSKTKSTKERSDIKRKAIADVKAEIQRELENVTGKGQKTEQQTKQEQKTETKTEQKDNKVGQGQKQTEQEQTEPATQEEIDATAKALEGVDGKEKRLISVLAFNKMKNDYNTGIRGVEDIKTWDEVLRLDDESVGQFSWGDFTREDAEKAGKENKVTIYSSYPIEDGVFVSTSKKQAEEYAGGSGQKVYSKTIPLDKVSWINGDEGQYFSDNGKAISEAYHKAKKDGSNPELVKAVEDLLTKAPTQYTEAATPAKKESGGVSGSALEDVGRTAKAVSKRVAVEHAGYEGAKRVTGANENTLELDGYGTVSTSQFINTLVENGRLPKDALKNRHIQLTDEYATKLLNENSDLFPKENTETNKTEANLPTFESAKKEYDNVKEKHNKYLKKDGGLRANTPDNVKKEIEDAYTKMQSMVKQERDKRVSEDKRDTGLIDGIERIKDNTSAFTLVRMAMNRGVIPERQFNEFGKNLLHIIADAKDSHEVTMQTAEIIQDFSQRANVKVDDLLAREIQAAENLKYEPVEEVKAPTQYTETATPAQKGSGVSGSALKDADANVNKIADEYLYHGTGEGAFRRIREEGLVPQGDKHLYFADVDQYARTYAQRKGNSFGDRILRVKKSDAYSPDENTTGGDFKIKDKINPNDIEIKHNGKWVKIQEYSDENIGIMPIPKAPTQYTEAAGGSALKDVESTVKAIEKNPSVINKIIGDEYYHGTSLPKSEPDFTTANKDKGVGVRSNAFMGTSREQKSPFFFITSERDVANDFAQAKKEYHDDKVKPNEKHTSRIIPFKFNEKNSKILDLTKDDYEFVLQEIGESPIDFFGMGMYEQDQMWEMLDEPKFAEKLKSLGYDAVKFIEPKRGIGIAVLNTDKIVNSTPKGIAEAYHKAKADGTNPELVKAVEELLGKKEEVKSEQKAEKPTEQKPTIEQQVKTFGVADKLVKPVTEVANALFSGLKKVGLIAKESVEDWLHIGKADKVDENSLDGFIDAVKKELPKVEKKESKIQSWIDKWNELKKQNDLKELDLFYNKVKVALNGYAQGKGVEAEFKELKKDIEDYAEKLKQEQEPKVSTTTEFDTKKQPINKLEDLQDVGEKIGGAKKDLAQALSEVTKEDIENKPLSKVFPRPDFKKLVAEGSLSQDAAILLNFIYDNIPAKPRKTYRLASWAKTVQGALETTQQVLEAESVKNTDFVDKIRKAITLSETLKRDYEIYSETLKGLGFPNEEVNLGGYKIKIFTRRANKETGNIEDTKPVYSIVKDSFIIKDFDTMEEAINGLKSILNNKGTKAEGTKFDIYQSRKTKEYFIGKKGAIDVVRLVDGFKTVKEARDFLTEKQAELQAMWDAMKAPKERRMANRPRVGTDWRKGENITSNKFQETFGFRGVEFGNWVNNAERQAHVNEAYDALMDLASVLGISPKALSLNGELGFAFGARGSGKFNAHYEAGKVVINLTKTRGAGSLAHEWWHALDNYFSRARNQKTGFITERPRDLINRDGSRVEGVRKEMIDAFKSVMDAISGSKLKDRSEVLDKTRSEAYWSTPIEMSARSFENYIIEKLAERNQQNDYLANLKSTEEWIKDTGGNIDATKNYPYPLKEESHSINEKFQQFFETIKEDESGKLYQIIGEVGAENLPKIKANLDVARQMELAGKTPKEIWLATGWERTKDNGKWKYDLPDYLQSVSDLFDLENKKDGEIISNAGFVVSSELRKAYPQLDNIPVRINISSGNKPRGSFERVEINGNRKKDHDQINVYARDVAEAQSILIHEIQHAIQEIEGFAKGGNIGTAATELSEVNEEKKKQLDVISKDIETILNKLKWYDESWNERIKTESGYNYLVEKAKAIKNELLKEKLITDYNRYLNLAGEVEARNTEKRLTMTPEQRREQMLSETEDVAEDSKIYIYGANEVMESRKPFGGNSGYVGYSMSRRAAQAYDDGKLTYSKLPAWAKRMVDAGLAKTNEWHHTSSYGNETPFYNVQQFFERIPKELKEKYDIDNIESFKDVPKELIKELDGISKVELKKTNNIKEVRKSFVEKARKELNDFNAKFKRFTREKDAPKFGKVELSEMEGKYGWFNSKNKSYNLPEYHSGIDYETKENYDKARELETKLREAENSPLYEIELSNRGYPKEEIHKLKNIGVITGEIMPNNFYEKAERNKDIIKAQLKELKELPSSTSKFNPHFNKSIDDFLTEKERQDRQDRHYSISEQGENFGSSYERRLAHEENDANYREIALERYEKAKEEYLNSDEVKKDEAKFNEEQQKAKEIEDNIQSLFTEEETNAPLFQQANAQYRIKAGDHIVESLKDFDGSLKAVTAIVHEFMHPTVVEIFNGAKEGNETGLRHANTIVEEYNKANPDKKVTVQQMIEGNDAFINGRTTPEYRAVQEFIAEAWEKYHHEGAKGFSKAFQEVLDAITQAFREVYKSLTGVTLTPELRTMFDELLGKENTQKENEIKENNSTQKFSDKIRNLSKEIREKGINEALGLPHAKLDDGTQISGINSSILDNLIADALNLIADIMDAISGVSLEEASDIAFGNIKEQINTNEVNIDEIKKQFKDKVTQAYQVQQGQVQQGQDTKLKDDVERRMKNFRANIIQALLNNPTLTPQAIIDLKNIKDPEKIKIVYEEFNKIANEEAAAIANAKRFVDEVFEKLNKGKDISKTAINFAKSKIKDVLDYVDKKMIEYDVINNKKLEKFADAVIEMFGDDIDAAIDYINKSDKFVSSKPILLAKAAVKLNEQGKGVEAANVINKLLETSNIVGRTLQVFNEVKKILDVKGTPEYKTEMAKKMVEKSNQIAKERIAEIEEKTQEILDEKEEELQGYKEKLEEIRQQTHKTTLEKIGDKMKNLINKICKTRK